MAMPEITFDLKSAVHPRAGSPRQMKLYLSETAAQTLENAKRRSGFDMSMIVDALILQCLRGDVPRSLRLSPGRPKKSRIDVS